MQEPLYRSRPGGFDLAPASMPEAQRINEFIHASHGLSNSFLVSTPEGRVVINTGMGFEAPVHKRNFDAVDASPTRYILLTQAHVDHVGGVDLFREEGTEVVAREGNWAYQEEDARVRRARSGRSFFAFAGAIRAASGRSADRPPGPPPVQSMPRPTRTFDAFDAFELGGRRFELVATPGGETTESMVVWLPQHRILFAGNVFGALWGHIPNLVTIRGDRYRDALQVVDTIDRVLALEPELVLYGHHQPIEGAASIREELLRLRGAVLHVHDRTVEYMNAGKDVYTAMREIRLPDELEVGEGYGMVRWDVRAIWETYLGWFHQRSTTELYATPPEAVHGDLAELAGGAQALAVRAREKLDAGAAVEALHLVEIALHADPGHTPSLDVAIEAHRKLETESDNFWLSSWLRHQLEGLSARRAEASPGSAAADPIRIPDLAKPVLTDLQRRILDATAEACPDFEEEEALLQEAVARTGLSDFGDEGFRSRLRVWLEAIREDDNASPVGRIGVRNDIVRYLVARLRVEDVIKRHPEILDEEIREPIIVIGLPRSGTTHLVNLISADRRLRSMPYWESREPVPIPGEGPGHDGVDPRFQRCQREWERMDAMLPLLRAMHPMAPDHVHEEIELQALDFSSYVLEWVAYVPRLRDAYLSWDQGVGYAYLKKVLKVLQWHHGRDRWVLKSPQHLEQILPLKQTFPDATFAVTARDPVSVIASTLTMEAYASRIRCKEVRLERIAGYWSDRIETLLRRCVRDRDALPADRSLDVLFHEFMADDVAMVERIYALAGLPMTDAARAQLEAYMASHPRGKHGRLAYDLAGDFGVDVAALRERFAFYYERFPVRLEDH